MYSIYKLTDLDTGKVYIGSTKQGLSRRLASHKSLAKNGRSCCTCKDFNWQNVEIEEIELVEVDHFQRERYHIENTDCVNKRSPIISEEERKEYQKEKNKKWRENNKEHEKEHSKEWYQNNKERRRQKITCECGSIVCRGDLLKHKRTKKHQKFLEQQ